MPSKITTASILLSSIHLTFAQQSVLRIPFYGYDTQSIVGSVVSADSTATTIQLACPSGTEGGDDCGLFPYQTLTIGPNTYHMDMSGDGFAGTQDCTSTSICAESAGGSGANFPGASTTTYEASDIETLPVTITAGASKTAGIAAATTTTGASSTSAVEKTTLVGGQGTASQTSQETSGSETETAAASGGTSTGAAVGGARIGEGVGIVAGIVGILGMMV